jgi:hypothetical protein
MAERDLIDGDPIVHYAAFRRAMIAYELHVTTCASGASTLGVQYPISNHDYIVAQ